MSFPTEDQQTLRTVYAAFDPGVVTGAGALVAETNKRLHLVDSFSINDRDRASYLITATDTLEEWCDYPDNTLRTPERYLPINKIIIEFPTQGRAGSYSTLLDVAETAAIVGTHVARFTGLEVEYFPASDLRRNGSIVPNSKRPIMFQRIFGNHNVDEHVVDAALIAAKRLHVF